MEERLCSRSCDKRRWTTAGVWWWRGRGLDCLAGPVPPLSVHRRLTQRVDSGQWRGVWANSPVLDSSRLSVIASSPLYHTSITIALRRRH